MSSKEVRLQLKKGGAGLVSPTDQSLPCNFKMKRHEVLVSVGAIE
jgi:hypothetical protein